MSPYQNHFYWENQLLNNPSFWGSTMPKKSDAQKVLFVHTAIVNYEAKLLDFNWSYYADREKLLGFLQFIFLPSSFYHWLNPQESIAQIPISNKEELLHFLQESSESSIHEITAVLETIDSYWKLAPVEIEENLLAFSQNFNQSWTSKNLSLSIHIFTETHQIFNYLKDFSEFPEIFQEDFGMTHSEFQKWCSDFYHNPMTQRTFLSLLQNKIGCIV